MTSRGAMLEPPAPAEDTYLADERRQAARALLMHPLLTADGPYADEFRLVRKHREYLVQMFLEGFRYRLEVESRAARLFKSGLGRDASRPLLRKNKTSFTPRAYAMLCLTLAALTRCKDQLLVDELVAQVRSAAADARLEVNLDGITDRRALHAALSALIGLGVLRERDQDGGGLDRWAEDHRARSLLDVVRDRLRLLVARGLTSVSSPDDLLDAAALPSAAGGARVAIRRLLVESPVLAVTDLTEEQADWWSKNRNREQDRIRDLLGLELELRAEGGLLIDPDDELSDIAFPGVGSTKHVALLLLERLTTWCAAHGAAKANPAERVWWPVPSTVVDDELADVATTYRKGLKKDHKDKPALLRSDVLEVLTSVGLVRVGEDGAWLVHAAGSRYTARPVIADEQPGGMDGRPGAAQPTEATTGPTGNPVNGRKSGRPDPAQASLFDPEES